ncbi:hypothetical protein TESG_01089 [Trichophyton tonsurans CBS 112818]|uniref:O-acyltransferase n=1 Tax=Trichophyton tonsurans (strain CBS 112818) TaxID=647933 RepID=F2RQE6_TRIT1|nr:hypothetical protein TESG_01089 [Trichophyton tonsurans CBS 112818]
MAIVTETEVSHSTAEALQEKTNVGLNGRGNSLHEKEKQNQHHQYQHQHQQHHRSAGQKLRSKYRHVAAYHSEVKPSCLSRETEKTPSFLGFRNLMVIVLIVMNLRLVVENFMKYGVLICIRCHDYRKQDLMLGAVLYALVPCHLFVAYLIELAAAQLVKGAIGRVKRDESSSCTSKELSALQTTWAYVAFAHTVNASLCLLVTTYVVYYYIHHPGIGTVCQLHAIIVWLKNCSYAFTNRDLRHAVLNPSPDNRLPEIYMSCPYPHNVTISNLSYFWLAPTLVYQPVYPRTERVRWSFVAKRVLELVGLGVFIWIISAQYAAPVLRNSLDKVAMLDWVSILERMMKLSTISLVIWLAGFFALFQSFLNALAEVMRFGDREFYSEWWNSPSVGSYWRSWNRPVYHFMKRHIFSPLVGRGWSPFAASLVVFTFSAVLHEVLVGIPTHNIIGVAFAGMMLQLPLIAATLPLEKMNGQAGKIIGNCVFWLSFCLVGQPLGALLYFFAWQAKYGSVSKQVLSQGQ